MEFHENWFSGRSPAQLVELVGRVAGVPGRIVEIGSWEGRSTVLLANATDRDVHAVDHWLGSPTDVSSQIAAERDVYAVWRANVDEGTAGNVVEHRMDWRNYRASDASPIALLFLDADHSYEEVSAQLEAFVPLMSPGGIVCGDDRFHDGVVRAVVDQFGTYDCGPSVVWWKEIADGA